MQGICVVEDEITIREGLRFILEHADGLNVRVFEAGDGRQCLDILAQNAVSVVITDVRMPEMNGLQLMRMARERYPNIRFIVLSGYDDFGYCKQALKYAAIDYLLKPVDEAELLDAVRRALDDAPLDAGETADAQGKRAKSMEHIMEYIKRHYAENITLESLANQFYYNANYISQLFKKEARVNFLDYLNQVRIQRAKQFLCDDGSRVEDVALRVGFNDPKYFSKIFKGIVGMTPSEYRRR